MAQQQDRHLTTEQLSAFVDQQVTTQERAAFEEHLRTCQQCQQKLADLRLAVAFLHALPQPALPRSFVLPIPAEQTVSQTNTSKNILSLQRAQEQRRRNRWVPAVRVISSIAAVLGLFLVLSAVLGPLFAFHGGGASSTTAGTAPYTQSNSSTTTDVVQQNADPPAATASKCADGTLTPCAAVRITATPSIPTEQPTPTSTQTVDSGSSGQPFLDLSRPELRLALGGILLALGVIGFFLLRFATTR